MAEKTRRELIMEAADMTKNIPATDGVLTPIEATEEKDLTPYPAIEYDVLFDGVLDKLVRNVNTRLEQGRQTEGGIQVVPTGSGMRFYQAMIRWNVDLDSNNNENADKTEGNTVEG